MAGAARARQVRMPVTELRVVYAGQGEGRERRGRARARQVRVLVMEADGVEGVVAAMRAHGGQEHVQCAGCLALMALVRGEGDVARACQWRVVRGRAMPMRAPGLVPAAVSG